MKGPALAILLSLVSLGPAVAQEADAPAIQGVIQDQVDAFLAEDAKTAFTYASPMIQTMFGTSENFRRMVETGYPMIWDPSGVKFLGLREESGRKLQRVMFTDAGGGIHLFDYDMVSVPDAGWKINGVYPVMDEGAGA